MYHIRHHISFSNEFIKDFKMLDFTLVRLLRLEPAISRYIRPQSDGVAIQKGNTYTYRTPYYSLFAVQDYHPGTYGDQQHVAGMNVDSSFSIFHTHPAASENANTTSPSYWVGYGHLPHVAQDSNVNIAIYNIPEKKGKMEKELLHFTHAFFPKEMFHQVIHEKQYVFGKKNHTYCALIGKNPFYFKNNGTDDLIQEGRKTYWIIEAGSKKEDNSFEKFCRRVRGNCVEFDPAELGLSYHSRGKHYQLVFGKDFRLNGSEVETDYQRFDSPYSQAITKPDEIEIEINGKSLHLDFYNLRREY
jgi:hypothetical protein